MVYRQHVTAPGHFNAGFDLMNIEGNPLNFSEIKCLYERGLFSAGQLMDDGKHKDEYHVKDIRSDQVRRMRLRAYFQVR